MITANHSFSELKQASSSHSGPNIALLPVGCIEQHGPVLPMATDTLIATGVCEELARQLELQKTNAVTYPAIAYSPSRTNLCYPYSTSVSEDAFRQYLKDICESLLLHQFDAIFIVCAHGPAEPSVTEVACQLNFASFKGREQTDFSPVVLLGVSELTPLFASTSKSTPGRHADWREFLLLFHILGRSYFTQERLLTLKNVHDSFLKQSSWEPSYIGIPLEFRSIEGVIGSPLPLESEEEYEQLSLCIWGEIITHYLSRIEQILIDICIEESGLAT
nr:creatininase family protein [uncultured Pseudodesulfovibrio sp.]